MDISHARRLSPRRNSTQAKDIGSLVNEQLAHFGIRPGTDYAKHLAEVAMHIYECADDLDAMWKITAGTVRSLDRTDRIAFFNAKKFLSFQIAKLLDNLQNPFRKSYQALDYSDATVVSKGPYAMIDNVSAIFSAHPVIARTATYVYACAEWIQDAFEGREFTLQVYSRLLNPTSIALANQIVELECGRYASEYLAWNFNSGMSAIDAALSHLLGRDDILITNKNVYGGAYQLIHDWYAKSSNLEIAVEAFDGHFAADFERCAEAALARYADRLAEGRKIYVYLESPCNPHGDLLDVPAICKAAHGMKMRVLLDSTVATPFLSKPLQRDDPAERPDFVIHSYTKDLGGVGSVIAGGVIARNQDMFIPKGEPEWDQTLFWNVYYVKGAFLNADAAFEVLQGMRTLDLRVLAKCINTRILSRFFAGHPQITVHGAGVEQGPNAELRDKLMFCGLPPALFTIDMGGIPREAFQRFFDSLAPTFDHMISLGQSNTIVSCPAFTTHSELDENARHAAGITPTMIRFAVGDEDPKDLIAHFIAAARLCIDPAVPGFSSKFMKPADIDTLVKDIYLDSHRKYIERQRAFSDV